MKPCSWKVDDWSVATDRQLAWEWQNQTASLSTGTAISYSQNLIATNSISKFNIHFVGPGGLQQWVVPTAITMDPDAPPPAPRRLPAPLAFSPTINATELVVEFLKEARQRIPGLTRERFLRLTIADFFAFLLRRAAGEEGTPPPESPELPLRVRALRCEGCGRFLPARFELARIFHCNARCLARTADRTGIVLPAGTG